MQWPGTGRELKVLRGTLNHLRKRLRKAPRKKKVAPDKKESSKHPSTHDSAKEDAFPVQPVDWLLCLLAKLETTACWTDVRIV